jgi:hypothetical protein
LDTVHGGHQIVRCDQVDLSISMAEMVKGLLTAQGRKDMISPGSQPTPDGLDHHDFIIH